MLISLLAAYVGVVFLCGCKPSTEPISRSSSHSRAEPNEWICQHYTYKIINSYPHDNTAFTQGLVFDDGFLYEGTGIYGHSTLRRVQLQTGRVVKMHSLASQYFGEGVTIFGDRIIQLTWQSHVGFVYDKESFKAVGQFTYPTEGWGITHDGKRLIMSDGSSMLYFLVPATFKEIGRIEVVDANGPVERLNELEYIKGQIYANVWQTDRIAIISPQTGQVTGWIDLTGILKPTGPYASEMSLNGIAYEPHSDRLFVTGKLWPRIFEIELVPIAVDRE
jgi:glutamine cyclotransferase